MSIEAWQRVILALVHLWASEKDNEFLAEGHLGADALPPDALAVPGAGKGLSRSRSPPGCSMAHSGGGASNALA